MKAAVQETLALLAGCFTDLDKVLMMQMEAIIMQNIDKVIHVCS